MSWCDYMYADKTFRWTQRVFCSLLLQVASMWEVVTTKAKCRNLHSYVIFWIGVLLPPSRRSADLTSHTCMQLAMLIYNLLIFTLVIGLKAPSWAWRLLKGPGAPSLEEFTLRISSWRPKLISNDWLTTIGWCYCLHQPSPKNPLIQTNQREVKTSGENALACKQQLCEHECLLAKQHVWIGDSKPGTMTKTWSNLLSWYMCVLQSGQWNLVGPHLITWTWFQLIGDYLIIYVTDDKTAPDCCRGWRV